MRIVIVEDELPAYNRLARMIKEVVPAADIVAHIDSIESGVQWFEINVHPDLMFIDIHLADGSGFELISQANPACPYIFTTAYDQYAIEAFKTNGIGYLMKPVKKEELLLGIHKLQQLKNTLVGNIAELPAPGESSPYKSRFMIRFGETIRTLATIDIAYCYSENKVTFARTFNGHNWPMDYNLDSLETMLDPQQFFRINRQYIISLKSIEEMKIYTKSRIIVKLAPAVKDAPVVSSERSAEFKLWLNGGS
ncbi:MAG: LytTR family DNA-binding domain-containing protein [Bacteroidota bacterium]